jgi:hypothetical protein
METSAGRCATYRLIVRGELDSRFAYIFVGMHMPSVRFRLEVLDPESPRLR